jgi:HNH endonuclease
MSREAVRESLAKTWHYHTIDIWQRARYKCEYCGKSLIKNPDDYLYDAHLDHIVPGMGNGLSNYALSCKACNYIKRDVDHRHHDESDTREALITRAAKAIAEKRKINTEKMRAELSLLKQLDEMDRLDPAIG